jgi:hypothetical protein
MSQEDEFYYVYWDQAKFQKSIPYNPSTNVPVLYTTASARAYHAFATTFEPLKHPSSNWRRSSNSQGKAAPSTSPTLYLKRLLWKRT